MRRSSWLCVGSVALLAILLAGCGGGAAPTSQAGGSATPLTDVNLRLGWLMSGYDAPLVLAKAKGYYKAAGFNVHILEGKGSATATETVANGSDTFGMVDAGTAALLISKGAPVKVIADFVQSSAMSFVARFPINSPKDLIGKTIITSAGDADYQMLPAVLATAGVDKSQIKVDLVDPASIPETLARMKDGIALGFTISNDLSMLKLVPDAVITPFSKFGFRALSFGLITSKKLIQEHPNEVRRFVAASIKGWEAAVKDPNAAVEASIQAFPHADKNNIARGLAENLKLLHTPESQGHPLGWMAPADWKATLDVEHRYGGMRTIKPVDDYYTNQFIPSSSTRT